MWTNKRIIFNNRKAQLPVAEFKDNIFNIYYTSRNVKNQNIGYKLTLDKNFNVLDDKLILEPGRPGSCDVSGVMPTAIWGRNLYYIGWTLRHDVPYYNYTCLAQEENGKYTKLGPVLHADTINDGYTGTLALLHTHHTKFAYYLNCIDWLPDENNSLQPSYNIGLAVTKDEINFNNQEYISGIKQLRSSISKLIGNNPNIEYNVEGEDLKDETRFLRGKYAALKSIEFLFKQFPTEKVDEAIVSLVGFALSLTKVNPTFFKVTGQKTGSPGKVDKFERGQNVILYNVDGDYEPIKITDSSTFGGLKIDFKIEKGGKPYSVSINARNNGNTQGTLEVQKIKPVS